MSATLKSICGLLASFEAWSSLLLGCQRRSISHTVVQPLQGCLPVSLLFYFSKVYLSFFFLLHSKMLCKLKEMVNFTLAVSFQIYLFFSLVQPYLNELIMQMMSPCCIIIELLERSAVNSDRSPATWSIMTYINKTRILR